VKGLNKAGFSDKDYKLADPAMLEEAKKQDPFNSLTVFPTSEETKEDITSDIDTTRISVPSETELPNTTVSEIEKLAIQQNEAFEKTVSEMEANNTAALPNEIQQLVKTYSIKDIFQEQAGQINLPQFYLKVPANDLFGKKEEELPLEKENLLDGFALSKADTNIAFDSITSELYKVDLDETKKEHTPTFVRLDGEVKESVMDLHSRPITKRQQSKELYKTLDGFNW
jgi:type III restriction enzyme